MAAAVAAVLLAVLSPAAPAPQPRDERDSARLDQVRSRRESLERDIAKLRRREKSLLGDVERLELEVRLRTTQLREVRLILNEVNGRLDSTVAQLAALEAEIDKMRPALRRRARELYKLGELSYLRMLLSVDRPSDLIRGYRFVATLARRDNERFSRFKANMTSAATAREQLELETQEAMQIQAEVRNARRRLDADRRRKTTLLREIVEKKETQAAYVAELKEAEAQLEDLISGFADADVVIPIGAFRGSLPWPAEGPVRSRFGRRKHPRFDTYTVQNGIEIAAEEGSVVRAVHGGRVVFADRFRGYGLLIVMDHGGKHHSLYAHLGEASIMIGDEVAAGVPIGKVGATGLHGAGLYFEMRRSGKPEDPLDWLLKRL